MNNSEIISHLLAAIGGGVIWQVVISTVLKDRIVRYLKKGDDKRDRGKIAGQLKVNQWDAYSGTIEVTNGSSSRLTGVRAELTIIGLAKSGLKQAHSITLDNSESTLVSLPSYHSIHRNLGDLRQPSNIDSVPLAWVDSTNPSVLRGGEISLNNEQKAHVVLCRTLETRREVNGAPESDYSLEFASEKGTSGHQSQGVEGRPREGAGYVFVVLPRGSVRFEGSLAIKSNNSTTAHFPFTLDVDGQTGDLSIEFVDGRFSSSH